jgi:hypothetical protein
MLYENLKKIIIVLNDMVKSNIIETYAIGGGISAVLYTEPVYTKDIDIFVYPETTIPGMIHLLTIYDYLRDKGFLMSGQFVIMYNEKVDFIPTYNNLVIEALQNMTTIELGNNILANVFKPEYIVAIALQTGRSKDDARIDTFIESNILDFKMLLSILAHHSLLLKWNEQYES